MATKEKLDSITASKAAIKAAIQEKGVSCDDTLAEYANRIKAIPTGRVEVPVNMVFDFNNSTATTEAVSGLNETSDYAIILIPDGYLPLVMYADFLRDITEMVYALTNELGEQYHILKFNSFDYTNRTIKFNMLLVYQDIVNPQAMIGDAINMSIINPQILNDELTP